MSEEVGATSPLGPPLPPPPPLAERRVYPNPPIVEGLVQFTFAQPIAWNVATPGRIFERIRGVYPADPDSQGQLQAVFNPRPTPDTLPDFTVSQGLQRVIFKDLTGTRLFVVNDRTFGVNSLRPYEGWENLSSRMMDAIAALKDVVDMPNISEVSVRYINQIPIPRGDQTEDYFTYEVRTVRSGASYVKNFLVRVESLLPDGVTSAGTTFGSVQPQAAETFPLILDIEFKRALGEGIPINEAAEVAVELKQLENSEFESVITDRTRELFT